MLFMVIEHFKNNDVDGVLGGLGRVRDRGGPHVEGGGGGRHAGALILRIYSDAGVV
jgi:hypothetical protein